MTKKSFTVVGEQNMRKLGEQMGSLLEAGDVLFLEGDLGAGKTTLSQGIGKGLGVTEQITSPTFTIVKEYEGRVPFYHMDVYRLTEDDFGLYEYLQANAVCLIEWASVLQEDLPKEAVYIQIQYNEADARIVEVQAVGERAERIVREL